MVKHFWVPMFDFLEECVCADEELSGNGDEGYFFWLFIGDKPLMEGF